MAESMANIITEDSPVQCEKCGKWETIATIIAWGSYPLRWWCRGCYHGKN